MHFRKHEKGTQKQVHSDYQPFTWICECSVVFEKDGGKMGDVHPMGLSNPLKKTTTIETNTSFH